MNTSRYPQWAYAAALTALPLQTYGRLRRVLQSHEPSVVWEMIRNGEPPLPGIKSDCWNVWRSADDSLLIRTAEECIDNGITVTTMRDRLYPPAMLSDPHAPVVIFSRGNLEVLRHRRVGIVGTRTATQSGRFTSRSLGEQLADAGVCVVSGLARGIDYESHIGAFNATSSQAVAPAAVVGSGLNKVYPPEHAHLWNRIGEEGVIISEVPPNTAPLTHHFPLRNRILASLSEVLVVVESRTTGGSMITVREAMKRDIAVMAVPGNTNLHTSDGTNLLLRDGCAPVLGVDDVLIALGLDTRREHASVDVRLVPTEEEREVLTVLGRTPRSLDELALTMNRSVVDMAVLLGRLEAKEWVSHVDGWWEALISPTNS